MSDSRKESSVQVAVRVRPLLSYETSDPQTRFVLSHPSDRQVCIHLSDGKKKAFTFDKVFSHERSQTEVFAAVRHMLSDLLDGYNVTFLAYGQTGSGKTFTMGSEAGDSQTLSHAQGLIPRFLNDLFAAMGPRCKVSVSFLEVYGNDVFDLLDGDVANHALKRRSLAVFEDENGVVQVKGLSSHPIKGADDAVQCLRSGTENRSTASTMMNHVSSRSHAIFTLTVQQFEDDSLETASVSAKLTFVDLAGSERLGKTHATGQRAREGIDINMGLLCLGNVINALADDEKIQNGGAPTFVPYRSHKLTRLLRDSLGGNSKTFFLACVSPASLNCSETLSTLTYANRARNIKNKPVKNLDPIRIELMKNRFAVEQLQRELVVARFADDGVADGAANGDDSSPLKGLLQRKEVNVFLNDTMKRIFDAFDASAAPSEALKNLTSGSSVSTASVAPVAADARESGDSSGGPVLNAEADATSAVATEKADEKSLEGSSAPQKDVAEEMEVLDRLWALHEREKAFFDEKEDHDNSITMIESEITEKEGLLQQLQASLEKHQEMKARMDALSVQVSALESEKTQLLRQMHDLSSAKNSHQSEEHKQRVVKSLKTKLKSVEDKLQETKADAANIKAASRTAEREAKRARELESQLNSLKASRVALMKKQKEAAAAHASFVKECNRRNATLRKSNLRDKRTLGKLQATAKKQQSTIERFRGREQRLNDQLRRAQEHISRLVHVQSKQRRRKRQRKGVAPGASRDGKDVVDSKEEIPRSDEDIKEDPSVACLVEVVDQLVQMKVDFEELNRERDETVIEYGALSAELMREVNYLKDLKRERKSVEEALEADADLSANIEDNPALQTLQMDIEAAEERVDTCGLRLDVMAGRLEELDECLERISPTVSDNGEDVDASENRIAHTEALVQDMLTKVDVGVCKYLVGKSIEERATLAVEKSRSMRRAGVLEGSLADRRQEIRRLRGQLKKSRANFERRLTAADNEVVRMSLASPAPGTVDNPSLARKMDSVEADLREKAEEIERLTEELSRTKRLAQDHERRAVELEECLQVSQSVMGEASSGSSEDSHNERMADTLQKLQLLWSELGMSFDQREDAMLDARGATLHALEAALKHAGDLALSTRDGINTYEQEIWALEALLGQERSQVPNVLADQQDGLLHLSADLRDRCGELRKTARDRVQQVLKLRTEAIALNDEFSEGRSIAATYENDTISPETCDTLASLVAINFPNTGGGDDQGDGAEDSSPGPALRQALDSGAVFALNTVTKWEDAVRQLRLNKRERQMQVQKMSSRIQALRGSVGISDEQLVELVADRDVPSGGEAPSQEVALVVAQVSRSSPVDVRLPSVSRPKFDAFRRVEAVLTALAWRRYMLFRHLRDVAIPMAKVLEASASEMDSLRSGAEQASQEEISDWACLDEMRALAEDVLTNFRDSEGRVGDAAELDAETLEGFASVQRTKLLVELTSSTIEQCEAAAEALQLASGRHWEILAPYGMAMPEVELDCPDGDSPSRSIFKMHFQLLQALHELMETLEDSRTELSSPSWEDEIPQSIRKLLTDTRRRAPEALRSLEKQLYHSRVQREKAESLSTIRRADESLQSAFEKMDAFNLTTKEHRRSKIQSKKMNSTYLLEEERKRKELQGQIKYRLKKLKEALRTAAYDIHSSSASNLPLSQVALKLLGSSHLESSTAEALNCKGYQSNSPPSPPDLESPPVPPVAPLRSKVTSNSVSPPTLSDSGSGGKDSHLVRTQAAEDTSAARGRARRRMAGGAFAMLLGQGKDKENSGGADARLD